VVHVGDVADRCPPSRFSEYLDIAVHPERYGGAGLDAGFAPPNEDFRIGYHEAIGCLGVLADQRAVQPILRRATADLHPYRFEDLISVLVRIGDRAVPGMVEALSSPHEAVRHLAAVGLVYLDTGRSRAPLVAALPGDDSKSLEASSFVLRELMVSRAVEEAEAFPIARRLANSIDPRVRRNAIRSLVLFERVGPVSSLLEQALEDSDPEVVRAAQQTLDSLRNAKIERYFGISIR
jgi:HEAT repeat protein